MVSWFNFKGSLSTNYFSSALGCSQKIFIPPVLPNTLACTTSYLGFTWAQELHRFSLCFRLAHVVLLPSVILAAPKGLCLTPVLIEKKKQMKLFIRVTYTENKFMVTGGKGHGGCKLRDWDWHIYTVDTIYKADN